VIIERSLDAPRRSAERDLRQFCVGQMKVDWAIVTRPFVWVRKMHSADQRPIDRKPDPVSRSP
jgi:hypothetical protein